MLCIKILYRQRKSPRNLPKKPSNSFATNCKIIILSQRDQSHAQSPKGNGSAQELWDALSASFPPRSNFQTVAFLRSKTFTVNFPKNTWQWLTKVAHCSRKSRKLTMNADRSCKVIFYTNTIWNILWPRGKIMWENIYLQMLTFIISKLSKIQNVLFFSLSDLLNIISRQNTFC